jgi:hypothetical protein
MGGLSGDDTSSLDSSTAQLIARYKKAQVT